MGDDVAADAPKRRFQVRLGGSWADLGEEEMQQINAGLQRGETSVEIESRGSTYVVDIVAKKQTNKASGKGRDIREVDETGADIDASDDTVKEHIDTTKLGPGVSLMSEEKPDWSWLADRDNWHSYNIGDSIELDRYWQAYSTQKTHGSKACLADVTVAGKTFLIDFEKMTCQLGRSGPRKLRRQLHQVDWLSNVYFFEAFKDALESGGIKVDSAPEEMFDFRWNQDFRSTVDDGRPLTRGGETYKLPVGWKRFAVHCKGEFDDGDNKWLREDDGGWCVAYHGTAKESLPGILSTGFRVGDRQKFEGETGKGIYCAPKIEIAQHYSEPKTLKGHTVQIVLQLRVKPTAIKHITSGTDFEKQYWVINSPQDMRPYGVLIRELPLDEFVTAVEAVFGPQERRKDLPPLKAEIKKKWGW